jgi:hypothetical protein
MHILGRGGIPVEIQINDFSECKLKRFRTNLAKPCIMVISQKLFEGN